MSVRGAESTEISTLPRMLRERTRCTPGTLLTASSSGRVMANTTCCAFSADPSAITATRGKVELRVDGGGEPRGRPDPRRLSSATAR